MNKFSKSEIMKKAHMLKKVMGYKTFSEALKHSWQVVKAEVIEKEQNAKREAVFAKWKAEGEAKRKAEIAKEKENREKSGLSVHESKMISYYQNNTYNGD